MNREALQAASALVASDARAAFEGLLVRGYALVPQTGVYPRVRAERRGRCELSVDFWMSLDADGNYRESWSPAVPFELGAAASINRAEDGIMVRYWKPLTVYADRPYPAALATLADDVIRVAIVIEAWDGGCHRDLRQSRCAAGVDPTSFARRRRSPRV